jgi:hypothetical protein
MILQPEIISQLANASGHPHSSSGLIWVFQNGGHEPPRPVTVIQITSTGLMIHSPIAMKVEDRFIADLPAAEGKRIHIECQVAQWYPLNQECYLIHAVFTRLIPERLAEKKVEPPSSKIGGSEANELLARLRQAVLS